MTVGGDLLEILALVLVTIAGAFIRGMTARINVLEADAVELKTRVAVGKQLHSDILARLGRIENLLEKMRGQK